MGIQQLSRQVNGRQRDGFVGDWVDAGSPLNMSRSMVNSVPQAAGVFTITVNAAVGSTDYSFNVLDADSNVVAVITYTSASAGATTTTIASGLLAAFRASSAAGSLASATSLANVITITGKIAGDGFSVTETDANLAVATVTAAAVAAPVRAGRVVIQTGGNGLGTPLCAVAETARFSTQTATSTITYEAAAVYTHVIRDPSGFYDTITSSVIADTDDNTTAAAVKADLDAQVAAASNPPPVARAVATNVVTLTSDVDGYEFIVEASATLTATNVVLANTVPASSSTSLRRAFAGICMRFATSDAATRGQSYAASNGNAGIAAAKRGRLWVDRPGAVTIDSDLYVGLNASEAGQIFTSSGTDRIPLGPDFMVWSADQVASGSNVAAVEVRKAV